MSSLLSRLDASEGAGMIPKATVLSLPAWVTISA